MGFDGDFAIASEDVDGLDGLVVYILYELLDRLVEDTSVLRGDWTMVFWGKVGNAV